MASQTPTPAIHLLLGGSSVLYRIVHVTLVGVGMDGKMIEEFKQKIVMSLMEAGLCAKNTELEVLQGIYVSTVLVPDLNSPPPNCWTTAELVSFCEKENAMYLSKYAEACLIQVGMEREAQDFKERVKAAAGFENSEAVRLWNHATLPYTIQKVLQAAGVIDHPEIPTLPPLNAIFPTPDSVGWNRPGSKEGPGVIIIEGCGGGAKPMAIPAAHAAGPSSLKKNETLVVEVDSSSTSD